MSIRSMKLRPSPLFTGTATRPPYSPHRDLLIGTLTSIHFGLLRSPLASAHLTRFCNRNLLPHARRGRPRVAAPGNCYRTCSLWFLALCRTTKSNTRAFKATDIACPGTAKSNPPQIECTAHCPLRYFCQIFTKRVRNHLCHLCVLLSFFFASLLLL